MHTGFIRIVITYIDFCAARRSPLSAREAGAHRVPQAVVNEAAPPVE